MKNFIVVSFYTENTPYEEEAKILIESLNQFNLDYDIQPIKTLGGWQANTIYKATFIRQMIEKHSSRPIVWMDVDAVVQRKPFFFNMLDVDAAFYFRTNGGRVPRIKESCELISAAMYFEPTEKTIQLIDMWIVANRYAGKDFEQHVLQKILPSWRKSGGRMGVLPQTYCKIFDSRPDHIVIVQNQASRRFKKKVGR